jgi:hypothetical protein
MLAWSLLHFGPHALRYCFALLSSASARFAAQSRTSRYHDASAATHQHTPHNHTSQPTSLRNVAVKSVFAFFRHSGAELGKRCANVIKILVPSRVSKWTGDKNTQAKQTETPRPNHASRLHTPSRIRSPSVEALLPRSTVRPRIDSHLAKEGYKNPKEPRSRARSALRLATAFLRAHHRSYARGAASPAPPGPCRCNTPLVRLWQRGPRASLSLRR